MAVYNPPRNGTAGRAVSLDLVLRTFMNSTDFQIVNSRMWDSIAKMVPGTTPQQCAQRWDELLLSSPNAVAGDFSGLTATGRPISSHERKPMMRLRSNSTQTSSDIKLGASYSADTISIDRSGEEGGRRRPLSTQVKRSFSFQGADGIWEHTQSEVMKVQETAQSRKTVSQLGYCSYFGEKNNGFYDAQAKAKVNQSRGSFVTSFCQNVLNRPKSGLASGDLSNHDELEKAHSSTSTSLTSPSNNTDEERPRPVKDPNNTESNKLELPPEGNTDTKSPSDIVIKVSDEAKKARRNFLCPRDILVREMPYFQKYLCMNLADAEISVHCDISIFEWLIKYVKRGMLSSPSGSQLESELSKPTMEPQQAISILISSYFLEMESLVEESLDYCHNNMSVVMETNGNLSCISQSLLTRLAAKFSPLEAEEVRDKRDRIKSKLFLYQLEQMFKPAYSSPECPSNASTLYMCNHCNHLLTSTQEYFLPCTSQRLTIDAFGKVVYNHERSPTWSINTYIRSLQQNERLTPRDIYWRLWGLVNVLYCDSCHTSFQCWNLKGCLYHPDSAFISKSMQLSHTCCCEKVTKFTVLPQQQRGCCQKEHSVSLSSSEVVYSILLKLQGTICKSPELSSTCHTTVQRQQQQQHQQKHQDQQASKPRHDDSPMVLMSPVRQRSRKSTLVGLLQKEQKQSCSTLALSQRREIIVIEPCTEHVSISSSTGSTMSNTSSKQQVQQQPASQEVSELEEDESEESERTRVVQYHTVVTGSKVRKKGHRYNRHYKQEAGSQLVEWIWNTKKTKRWNQDMQRESDERRQTALCTQLSQMSSVGSSTSKNNEVAYAGGIFPRLEAQFRVQHTAKAMAMHTNQSRSHAAGKKRTYQ